MRRGRQQERFFMREPEDALSPAWLWGALIGIQSGVVGGLSMLAWFLLASSLLRQPLWTMPNLIGALLSEDVLVRRGFGWNALVGVAVLLVWTGLLGALFGLATHQVHSRRRLLLLGLLSGVMTFYVSNAVVFRKLGAVAWVYSSPRSLLVAHLLLGVALGLRPVSGDRLGWEGPKPGASNRPEEPFG